ncbi:MAG: tetratricopeptide repeat protein [Cyclobacteriaceae bacterium]
MKASSLPLIIMVFSISLALGQNQSQIDSLKQVLGTAKKDTNKVSLYQALSHSLVRSESNASRMYADSMLALAKEIGFEKGQFQAYYQLGLVDRFAGNYKEAMGHFTNCYEYHLQNGDSLDLARSLFQMGILHDYLGNYDKSLASFLQTSKIYEEQNDTYGVASTKNSIGVIYMQLGKNDLALTSFEEAIKLHETLNKETDMAIGLRNTGTIYVQQQKFDQAIERFTKSKEVHQKVGNKWGVASNLLSLGEVNNLQKKYVEAVVYFKEAIGIYRELSRKKEVIGCSNKLAQSYLDQRLPDKAIPYLQESVKVSQAIESKPYLQESLLLLSDAYAQKRDYNSAYAFHKQYTKAKDSILTVENSRHINELQTKYETEKKEQAIVILGKEKELQQAETKRQATLKKASLGGLAFVILLAGFVLYTFWQRLKNQKLLATKDAELNKENFQKQVSQLEMKALRAQMNPHFIFNSMNSINSMILVDDTENASRYLTKFSKLVRLILENSENSTVSLKDELEMLETYIQLEAKRFEGKINYQFSIDPEIDQETTKLPSMVLQPFIENAIWHGLRHKQDEGVLKIILKEQGDQLKCVIEDNGIGREKALALKEKKLHKHKPMGLKLTEERLKLLNKSELKKLINFTDLKDKTDRALGTRVEVIIPVS